jgi:hypothetical protein
MVLANCDCRRIRSARKAFGQRTGRKWHKTNWGNIFNGINDLCSPMNQKVMCFCQIVVEHKFQLIQMFYARFSIKMKKAGFIPQFHPIFNSSFLLTIIFHARMMRPIKGPFCHFFSTKFASSRDRIILSPYSKEAKNVVRSNNGIKI